MSFPRYERYKDSGVECLGEVPEGWEICHLKRVCELITDGAHISPVTDGGIHYFISTKDVVGDGIDFEGALRTSEDSYILMVRSGCKPNLGDVLFSKDGTIGRTVVVKDEVDFVIASSLIIIRPSTSRLDSDFLNYLCQSHCVSSQVEGFVKGAGLPRLSIKNLLKVIGIFPSVIDQRHIAGFLDHETSKIDTLISEQQKLIDLLKEKRQAVISHAVTKGLNPLVKMKDSGVEWLGEVPEHWEIGAVKRFFTVLDGKRVPLSSEERGSRSGEYPYYGASGIIDYIDDYIFSESLILVSEDGANLLSRSTPISFIAYGKYWVNNHAHILKPMDDNLFYWAERIECVDLVPFVTGSAQPKLTIDALANIMIAVPPTTVERLAIQEYCLLNASKMDVLISEAQKAIALLQERRSALISAAVTGKIDVRKLS